MISKAAIGVVLVALAGCAHLQSADRQEAASRPIVRLEEIGPTRLRAGESTTVAIPIVIADGFHVQANPASQEFLIPLELDLEPSEGLELGRPAYPPPLLHRLEGDDEDLFTYEGALTLDVPVRATRALPDLEVTVVGKLRYQACDDMRCYFPRTAVVSFRVRIDR